MGFAVTLAVYAGLYVLSKLLANRNNKVEKEKPGQVAVPPEGTPIPLYWGRVRFSSAAIVWNSKRRVAELQGFGGSGEARDTQAWHVHALLILGIPQEGYGAGGSCDVRFRRLYVNGVRQSPFNQNRNVSIDFARDDTTFETADADVLSIFEYGFGSAYSDLSQSANGTLYFETGLASQGNNSLMGSNIFVADSPGNLWNEWPSYRSQTKILLSDNSPRWHWTIEGENRINAGFAYVDAESDPAGELPAWEFEVASYATLDLGGGRPLIRPMVRGDANPAGVIFDIITAPWAKLGIDPSTLDLDSFAAAGETLYEENHGFSLILSETTTAKELISTILAQIDGLIYEDPETSKLVLSLTREDYVISSLPEFDETNVIEVMGLSTSAFDETYNEVRVVFTNGDDLSYKESTAIAQDMANLASQGGRVRAITRAYPGVTSAALAAFIASRDLAEVSVPLISLRIKVNRDGFVLRPNQCFKFSWEEYGIVDMVFRVANLDYGTLEDSCIVIEAGQDHFAVTSGIMEPAPIMPTAVPPPRYIERRLFTEAPRWFIRQGIIRGQHATLDVARGYYLGAQPEAASSQMMARVGIGEDGDSLVTDLSGIGYPRASGVVETAYSRTAEPYDTLVGLRVTFDGSFNYPLVNVANDIAYRGRNVIYVGNEIMAFESAVLDSGTTYTLQNVWRGLLDTVPTDHAVGEAVFVLSGNDFNGDFFIGRALSFDNDQQAATAFLRPLTNGVWMATENDAVEPEVLPNPRGRTLLPYPAADAKIDGTKGANTQEEEGFQLSWSARSMNRTTITRGDGPSEDVGALQYQLYARKIGPLGLVSDEKLIGIADSDDGQLDVAASEAGYGTLAVFPRALDLATNFTNWQDPELHVTFPHWRNLLANCRFVADFSSNVTQPWVIDAGEATRRTDLYPLGGLGTYVSNNGTESVDIEFHQDVYLSGWPSRLNMGALVTFYHRTPGTDDSATIDELTVVVEALDISGSVVLSETTGTILPKNWWQFHFVALANLPSTTHRIRVRITMDAVDEPPNRPDIAVAEFALRVGQIALPTVTNSSFDVDLTGWTNPTGTFTRQTTVPYIGDSSTTGGYARGGTGTTNELYQDIVMPTGYEFGTVVCEFAQGDEGGADNDLGYVQLDARSSGGTVLASASVAAIKAVSTPSQWARRRVVLENLPVGTANVRVRLIATRTAAGTADACFDDVRVMMFKELDPDYKLDLSVTTPPSTRFPKTGSAWYDVFPNVPPPDVMLYDGERLEGHVGIEPDLGTPTTPYLGKLHGPYDGDHDTWSTSVYDFRAGCNALEAVDDGAGHFANFAAGEGLTIVAVVRPGYGNSTTRRICGRIDGTTGGWCLELLATGRFQARIRSGASQWVASPTLITVPGGLYCVQMMYDPIVGTLTCAVNNSGAVSTPVPTGTSIWAATDLVFRVGKAEASDTIFHGQVARLYGWRSALANFMPDMDTFGGVPPGITQVMTCSQTGQCMVPLGDDDAGVTYAVYAPGHIPLGRGIDDWGYAMPAQVENFCPSRDLTDATAFPPTGTVTLTRTGIVGPTGEANGIRINASIANSGFRVSDIPVTSSTTVHVYWFARLVNPGFNNVRLRLLNTSGVQKGLYDYPIGGQWELYEHVFTTWDDSTANCQLEFSVTGISANLYEVAGPIIMNQDSQVHHVLPYNDLIVQHQVDVSLTGITQQFNHEGEIYVEGWSPTTAGPSSGGLAIDVHNNVNNNDRRLYTISNASGSFAHYNASGTSATGTSGAPTWTNDWNARARWQRAGLLDSLTSWARSLTNGTASSARAATFPASTTPLVELNMSGGVNGIVRRLILFAREVILGQDV